MAIGEAVPNPGPGPDLPADPALMPDPVLEPIAPARPPFPWKTAAWLLAASTAGTLLVQPYSVELLREMKGAPTLSSPLMVAVIVLLSLVIEGVMSAAAIGAGLGLGLGPRVGLGRPLLVGLDGSPDGRLRAWKAVGLSAAVGVALGVIFLLAVTLLQGFLPDTSEVRTPSVWTGFLGSIGAGVREEIWLRLGFLTFLAWLGVVTTGRRSLGAGVFWSANVLSALLFGALHLPQTWALEGLSAPVLAVVFLGNGIPGVVFGWLYRRSGLVAAMVSHITFDIVLKVISPLLGE